jgi:hypothetical protein
MMLTLTTDEVTQLTGYKRACDQRRFLQATGLLYRLNKQNKPIVSRANAEKYLGGTNGPQSTPAFTPNWSAMTKKVA